MTQTARHERPAAGRRLDDAEQKLAAHQSAAEDLAAGRDVGPDDLGEAEIGFDEVQDFLGNPASLAADKTPALLKYYGHLSEVAARLLMRDDCPPPVVADICRQYGSNPAFADYMVKHCGQLSDAENIELHDYHRDSLGFVINQLVYQQLPPEVIWQTYRDWKSNRYVVIIMISSQENLPEDLSRQFWQDFGDCLPLAMALLRGPSLPEDIIRSGWDQYHQVPDFVDWLFQFQPNLPVDIVREGYGGYDRSFEAVLSQQEEVAEQFGDDNIALLFNQSLVSGPTLSRLIALGIAYVSPNVLVGGLPESAVTGSQDMMEQFLAFVVTLIKNNQFDRELAGRIQAEIGQSMRVATALVESWSPLPDEIVLPLADHHLAEPGFVRLLLANYKHLPGELLDRIVDFHCQGPDFDIGWLNDQANLSPESRKKLRQRRVGNRLGEELA